MEMKISLGIRPDIDPSPLMRELPVYIDRPPMLAPAPQDALLAFETRDRRRYVVKCDPGVSPIPGDDDGIRGGPLFRIRHLADSGAITFTIRPEAADLGTAITLNQTHLVMGFISDLLDAGVDWQSGDWPGVRSELKTGWNKGIGPALQSLAQGYRS